MAKYTGPVCRLCRREGMKLYLKGDRCYTEKCAIEKRNYPPGQHSEARGRFLEYGLRLREKQKVKRMYNLTERQFKRFFEMAERMKGIVGTNFLVLLERRLDNVVYRSGFASSRREARQLVSHKHVLINGRCVNIPSYLVKPGDVVEIKNKNLLSVKNAIESVIRRGTPRWLEVDKANLKTTVRSMPVRDDITMPIKEQLIVEFYSK